MGTAAVIGQEYNISHFAVHTYKDIAKAVDMDIRLCRFRQEEAMLAVMPFCQLDRKLFERGKRNMLTSAAASCYPFTSYEMSDENGILLGVNKHNNSLVIVDSRHPCPDHDQYQRMESRRR